MIELYSDGSASPNPGEMAIGGVLIYKGNRREFSAKIGHGTNNIAELTAIKHGLSLIKNKAVPIVIISDSQYALNCIKGNWNPTKNRELISEIQTMIKGFSEVKFKWVRGHTGNGHQERAHELSNQFFANSCYL